MSYWAQKIKESYYVQKKRSQRVPSSMHRQFRGEWESGLAKALQETTRLRNEGWELDSKSPMTKKQANRIAKEKAGAYDSMQVPVAKWSNEEMVYLLYKPKPVEEAKPEPERKEPAKQVSYEEKFRKVVADYSEESDEATLIDKSRTIAFIKAGAWQKSFLADAVKRALNEGQQVPIRIDEYVRKIIKKHYEWDGIKIGEIAVSPKLLLKAGNIIGSRTHTAYVHEDAPVIILLPDNSMLALAQYLNPTYSVNIKDIMDKAAQLKLDPTTPY